MNKTHKKLTLSHRDTIERMDKAGHHPCAIATAVEFHRTSIVRELIGNRRDCGRYEADWAHAQAMARKARAPTRMHGPLKLRIELLLLEGQSPAEICERLREADPANTACAETIYAHTYRDCANGGRLHEHLPMRRRRRKKRRAKGTRHGPIPARVDISERPPEVDALSEHGHYEGDTVHGVDGAMVTLVERLTGFALIWAVPNLRKITVANAIIAMTRGYRVKTITFDNGSEFADHVRITEQTTIKCYFATPGRPCQRGRNENKNRQLRVIHRKGKVRYRHMRKTEVRRAQDRLNNKKRKGLGWKCANDLLTEIILHGPLPDPSRRRGGTTSAGPAGP